jgi:hypothetical protein
VTMRCGGAVWVALIAAVLVALGACRLRRPEVVPVRMIEPRLIESARAPGPVTGTPVRLLDTQARAHIGRHLLRRQPDGELLEDPVWRWTSAPDRYLDTALRLALAASREARLVDSGRARALAVTLVEWHLEAEAGRLVAAVTLDVTTPDRSVGTTVIRADEAVSADLPGDLAAASGRLLQRLASDVVARAAHQAPD